MKQLLLATNNHHKMREIRAILSDLGFEILSLSDISSPPSLIEDQPTFQGNALKKARTVFQHTNILSLADDSGLEVFYLNGNPGVHSARYAGKNSTDHLNNRKLLRNMMGVPPRRRKARFVSVLALVGNGFEEITEGVCLGRIGESPRGSNGFGYDPLFIPDGYLQTYAELEDTEKNKISHRAQSLKKMRLILERISR